MTTDKKSTAFQRGTAFLADLMLFVAKKADAWCDRQEAKKAKPAEVKDE